MVLSLNSKENKNNNIKEGKDNMEKKVGDKKEMISSSLMCDSTSPAISYCDVVIVGAGVSGLQCAASLVEGGSLTYDNIVILEARDRIGGRVYTCPHEIPNSKELDPMVWIDHGAAWVHGTDPISWGDDEEDGFHEVNPKGDMENPILNYLDREKDLNPIVRGNPWMRPYSVLHRTQNIAIYVQQQQQQKLRDNDNHPDGILKHQQPFVYVTKHTQQVDTFNNDNHLINAAVRRHYQIIRFVEEQIRTMYMAGRGMEVDAELSLLPSLDRWNTIVPVSKEHKEDEFNSPNNDDDDRILALTSFYQRLCTYWYGFGLNSVPLGDFADGMDEGQHNNPTTELVEERKNDTSDSSAEAPNKPDDPLWDDDKFGYDGDFDGPHCIVRGGMQKVVQRLCTPALRNRIRLNQEVVQIQKDNTDHESMPAIANHTGNGKDVVDNSLYKIRVETKSGSIVCARACVVTIPVGCLRENHKKIFGNPLSLDKLEAFEKIGMGKYKKVLLTFDNIFWSAQPAFLGMVVSPTKNSPLGTCLLIDNFWARDGYPCFEAILSGDQGVWATHKSDTLIRDTVLDFIQSAMGLENLSQSCLACHITRWEEDPYSRGAFAGLEIGGLNRHMEAYRSPEWDGCLWFGGDASSNELQGCVPAALLAGKNMAKGVLNHLGYTH